MGGERHEGDVRGRKLAATEAEFFLGEHHDTAALGRLVSERGELRGIREAFEGNAGRGDEVAGLAVTERDRAGFVEQENVDVSRGLDSPAGGGEDIALEQPVHPCDADRTEQATDGGGNQADEKRDQRGDREGDIRIRAERLQCDDDEEEDDRECGEENRERDFVRSFLPRGALNHRDHAVDERMAGLGGDFDDDAVAEDARAARDGAAIAAALPDNRGGFAGDGGLVDGGDALDDVAIRGDHIAGFADDEVAFDQIGGGDLFLIRAGETAGEGLCPGALEGVGLGFAAPLGDGLGEVGEQHREQ